MTSGERPPAADGGHTAQDWLGAPSDMQRSGPAHLRRQLMPAASLAFRLLARIEPLFSSSDRGAGYVVIARLVPAS